MQEPLTCTRPTSSACIDIVSGNIDIDFQGNSITCPGACRMLRASGTAQTIQVNAYNGAAKSPVQQAPNTARAFQSQFNVKMTVSNFRVYNFSRSFVNIAGGSMAVRSCLSRQFEVGGTGQLAGALSQSTGSFEVTDFDTEVYSNPAVANPTTSFGVTISVDATNQDCGSFTYNNVRSVAKNPLDFHCANGGIANNVYGQVRGRSGLQAFGMQVGWNGLKPTRGQWNNVTIFIEPNLRFAEGAVLMTAANTIYRDLTISGPAGLCDDPNECGAPTYSGALIHFYPSPPQSSNPASSSPLVVNMRGVTLNPTTAGQAAVIVEPSDTWFFETVQPNLQVQMSDVQINSAPHGVGIWQDFDVDSIQYSGVNIVGGHVGMFFEHNSHDSQFKNSQVTNACIGTYVGPDTTGIQVKQNVYQGVNTPQQFLSPVLDQANLAAGTPAGDCSVPNSVITLGAALGYGARSEQSDHAMQIYKSRGEHLPALEL